VVSSDWTAAWPSGQQIVFNLAGVGPQFGNGERRVLELVSQNHATAPDLLF
jgi:hypothetical protein